MVAISLDGSPLGTEVIRGTHAGDDELSAYVARNRYSSKRAPKAAAMIEHLKQSGAMTAVQSACMVYDPFVYHRGAASDGPKTGGRLFIMLCAASLSADDQKAMRSTNDIKRAWKIPPVERPPGDEEESSSEEDSATTRGGQRSSDEGDSDDGEDAAIALTPPGTTPPMPPGTRARRSSRTTSHALKCMCTAMSGAPSLCQL